MADIIEFPAVTKSKDKACSPAPGRQSASQPSPNGPSVRQIIWVLTVLCWPMLRFIMVCVGADPILTHRADRKMTQGGALRF